MFSRTFYYWLALGLFIAGTLSGLPVLGQTPDQTGDITADQTTDAAGIGIDPSTTEKAILEKIESYRMPDRKGYMAVGTMIFENGEVFNIKQYSREDGTFVKIVNPANDRFYFGLRSSQEGTYYISSTSRRWSDVPPFTRNGELNFGDLLLPGFSNDYNIIKIEAGINIEEKLITLAPKNLNVPYGKIILRVNAEYIPLEAQLYSLEGEIKHYVLYKKYRLIDNKPKPSRMIFTSTIYKSHPIVVEISAYQKIEISGNFFSINNLSFFENIE